MDRLRGIQLAQIAVLGLTGAAVGVACPRQRSSTPAEDSPRVAEALRGPAWPASPAELDALLVRYRHGVRPDLPPPVLRSGQLAELMGSAKRLHKGLVGWARIEGWLRRRLDAASRAGRRLFVLWGVHHDSAGQVAAFGRLALASPRLRFDLVVVEQLDADGHWSGLPVTVQQGDDRDIDRVVRGGDPRAWERLRRKQRRDNFTARKYGYLDRVLGLLAAARRHGTRLVGCDMNLALQRRVRQQLRDVSPRPRGNALLRLRELHCWLALQSLLERNPRVRHVAMLWGQSHVHAAAFPNFVPGADEVLSIYLFGQRLGPHGIEKGLPAHLRAAEPLLLPLGAQGRGAVLLLP